MSTPWRDGRFDGRGGPSKVLFGRMYEDTAIELAAFRPRSRVFAIASAGCTAMRLAAADHEVVAVDINADQLAYAEARLGGAPAVRGTAERVMDFARRFAPLVGWTRRRVSSFLELDDPRAQAETWRMLDTRRLRFAFGALFSFTALRAVYASPFLAFLPRRLGAVMRSRLGRGFARHANRTNPFARALLLGELDGDAAAGGKGSIELVHADAAAYLEAAPAASFDAFTLSNILDGASPDYRARLFAAVRRAAAPGATVVLRSFGEPAGELATNRAADDRALLWGIVDVRPVTGLA